MNIDFYSYSGQGGRPINEDSYACGEGYYVVSDGLGGHDNGEVASAAAVNYIAQNYSGDISEDAVSALLAGADNAVRTLGGSGKATAAALFTNNGKIRISNVGDSRVYYFRRGSIFFRTKDHSVCQASVDMGEMTDDDVRHSADRSGLLKVLGDSSPLKVPKPYELIDPQDGDAFLICSDGFWEHIYDLEMQSDLLKSGNAREWLEHMLKRLLLRSENSGDNFTAVCGMIHAPDKLPKTTALSEDFTVDYPTTVELDDASAEFGGKGKLITACVIAAAVVAIGIITAVLIYYGKGSPEDPDGSSNGSEMSSSIIESSSQDEQSEPDETSDPVESSEPDDSEETSGSDESSEPDDSEEISEPDEPSAPEGSSESDEPSEPNESSASEESSGSDSPDEPSRPELPETPTVPPTLL